MTRHPDLDLFEKMVYGAEADPTRPVIEAPPLNQLFSPSDFIEGINGLIMAANEFRYSLRSVIARLQEAMPYFGHHVDATIL